MSKDFFHQIAMNKFQQRTQQGTVDCSPKMLTFQKQVEEMKLLILAILEPISS